MLKSSTLGATCCSHDFSGVIVKALFDERVGVQLSYCVPSSGSFGTPGSSPSTVQSWDHCREQFAAKFVAEMPFFYFTHHENAGRSVAEFITRFESLLGVPHSRYSLTTHSSVLKVTPSKFWMDCYYKRSLLTLLARCGQNYDCDCDNFDDAIFGPNFKETQYIRDTKPAVLRFMFGFTRYVGPTPSISQSTVVKHGWKEEFEKLDTSAIRKKLILPEQSGRMFNIVGIDSLWT